ncbi:AMP-binding protein [Candidatus Poriferisodalis sp.]|uniref:AMP-binding protein n=1 Tax=Candidatus Poriferisodalis sp. TaxID=3101277 RepID=UPI003B023FA2
MPAFAKAAAAMDPTGFALVDPNGEMTWGQVDLALNRCAQALLATALGPRRRIAVFAENAAEVALAHLGGLLAGCSSVPVNFHLNAAEAAYVLADSQTEVLFVGPATAERGLAAARTAGVSQVVGWDCDALRRDIVPWTDWLADADDADPPDDITPLANLLYTSGTTGTPKGTELPPTMFAGGTNMSEHLAALAAGRFAGSGTHLVVGPMYHTGPLSGMRLLATGTPSVILGRFDAEATLAAVDRYRTGSSVMVPTHFVRLLGLPPEVKDRYDVSSMRLVAHTGASCPVEVKQAMIDWWGPVFTDAYGATEVGTVCSITSEEWLAHRGSVGRPIAPFSALVLDEAGNELAPNTEGRLYFRDASGRGIVYPNDPAKTAASNPEPGLFTLGEIGRIDDDGYVYVTDRFSDMVVSGGANLYPAEAEQHLVDHPAIADVACIGVPHPEMGEELRALIVPRDGAVGGFDAEEVAAWLATRLTPMKCPRSYELVADLGRSTMGKLNKRRLREAYLAGELALPDQPAP